METGETLKTHFREVTDKKLIAKYDKMPLYVPPDESPDTLDQDIMKSSAYAETAKQRGQHRPIEVAINENDPIKDSKDSSQRIHLRIINGRHRYFQDPNWEREYYHIDNILEYFEVRKIFDFQKETTPEEKTVLITQIAEVLRNEGIPDHNICAEIKKRGLTRWPARTVERFCPLRFKNPDKATVKSWTEIGKETNKEKMVKEQSEKIVSEKDQELKRCLDQNREVTRQIVELTGKLGMLSDEKKSICDEHTRLKDTIGFFTHSDTQVEVRGMSGIKVNVRLDLEHGTYIVVKI